MNSEITAAAIGATTALFISMVKDLASPTLMRLFDEKRSARNIYNSYAQPLVTTCVDFVWRGKEIIIGDRGHFLLADLRNDEYTVYKQRSTIYRLSCLIGTIRAIEKELSYGNLLQKSPYPKLRQHIKDLQSALADGPHIEQKRVRRLAEIWNIELQDEDIQKLGIEVEQIVYKITSEENIRGSHNLQNLNHEKKRDLIRKIADCLTSNGNKSAISDAVLDETLNQSISSCAYIESWVYRDWQKEIGDIMLTSNDKSLRSFELISYGSFVEEFYGDRLQNKPWVSSIKEMFTDVDMTIANPNDARPEQIKSVCISASKLLIALKEEDVGAAKEMIDGSTLSCASKIAEMQNA